MNSQELKLKNTHLSFGKLKLDQASKLPDHPGVYKFLRGREILYIGKATSLKDRVRSYFNASGKTPASAISSGAAKRGPKIEQMLVLANKIDWQETDSVLEALLLETELIKKHQPPYNTREKDDKSYWYVVITKEDFPRVLQIRGRQLDADFRGSNADQRGNKPAFIFGPYPYATEIKEALKIIRRIFSYRDKCLPCLTPDKKCKPCFNRQIGLCPGVCSGEISKTDYQKIIKNLKLFFEGKKLAVIKNLEREMKDLAKKQEFEKAGKIRNQIFALQHIQDVSLLKKTASISKENMSDQKIRIEAYDVAHISGSGTVGAMTVWQEGELAKNEYRRFKLRGEKSKQADDTANLAEILRRRFGHSEWSLPNFIVVDGGIAQINMARKVLAELGISLPVVSVVKDEKHRFREILGDKTLGNDYQDEIKLINSEVHRFAINYHRKIMRRMLK